MRPTFDTQVMSFQIGDMVFHLTADKPYSIICQVIEQTSENSFTLQTSDKMPGGPQKLYYVLPEDMQLVHGRKKKEIVDQFPIGRARKRNFDLPFSQQPAIQPGEDFDQEEYCDEYHVIGNYVYVINHDKPYALCYQLMQGVDESEPNDFTGFNAVCSTSTPGGQHLLNCCYSSDMQLVRSQKKLRMIQNQFLPVPKNTPVDLGDAEELEDMTKRLHAVLEKQGYPPCPIYIENVNEDTPIPPQLVFDALELDMMR